MPKFFYGPHNASRQQLALCEGRITIHWDPNVVTDLKSTAMVSFFSTDFPGIYTIKIGGMNMNGGIRAARSKILIEE